MANYEYRIGPWVWTTSIDGMCWRAPRGAVGAIDLANESALLSPGADRSLGFFAVAVGSRLAESTWPIIATGDLREIAVTKQMVDAWQSETGYRPSGDRLVDLLYDHLTNGSDPDWGATAKPLIPTVRGNLDVHLGGHSLVKRERFRFGEHGHTARVEALLQRDFRREFEDVERGKAPPDHHRRVLDYWIDKYNLDRRDAAQWRKLIPPDLRRHVPGPLKHATTLSDDFNRSDESLDAGNWTETDGNWSVSSNQLLKTDTNDAAHPASCRYDSDLSSDDQSCDVDYVAEVSGSDYCFIGPAVRVHTSAKTFYSGYIRRRGTVRDLGKCVAGTYTSLSSDSGGGAPPHTVLLTVDGSSLALFDDGVSALTSTDTSITGNLRCGAISHGNEGGVGDNWSCADLAVGGGVSTDAATVIVDCVPQASNTTHNVTITPLVINSVPQTPGTTLSISSSSSLIDVDHQVPDTTLSVASTTLTTDVILRTPTIGGSLSVSVLTVEAVAVAPTTTLSYSPESSGVTVVPQTPTIAGAITISMPESPWMYQRNGSGQADIGITVTWVGEPTAIRARWNGGVWETIDASPEGGSSSGTLSNQTAGQGTLEVDFANDAGVTDSAALITIGDIPLTLGQSNANGWLTNPQSYSGDYTALMWKRDGSGWEELADPTGYITSYGSVWPLLATLWMADQNVPVGFIHMAQNGNALVDGPWDPGNPGASYTATVARLAEAGITDAAVVLYDQGEADAGNDETQQDYEDTLDLLVSSFASDTGINAPWIVAQTGTAPSAPDAEAIDRIRAAQVSRWENNANIYPGPLGYDRAGVHWESDAEAVILAGRWWAALDATVFDGSSSRGPRVQSASEAEGRTKINIRFNAALLTSLTLETDPWEVDDDGTPATIDSISYSGSTVTLTLSTALTGSGTTVSFASFNSGAGHVVPLGPEITLPDATSVSLPVEPFYDTIVSEEAAQAGSTLFQPLFTGHF